MKRLIHHQFLFLILLATSLLVVRSTRAATDPSRPDEFSETCQACLNPVGSFNLTERVVETETALNSRPLGVNAPSAQIGPGTVTNTAPTGAAAVTAQAGNGTLTNSAPAGAISPATQAQDSTSTSAQPTGLAAPSAQTENSTLTTTAPTGSAPITAQSQDSNEIGNPTGVAPISIQAADSITTTTPQGDVPDSLSDIYYTGVLTVSGQTLYFLLSDPLSPGDYQALDLSLGDDVFGETAGGSLSDGVVVDEPLANDERLTGGPDALQIGTTLDFDVTYTTNPAAEPDDAGITAASWFSDNLNVDVDDDGLTESVNFVLGDTNSDGYYDTIDLSLNATYGQGNLDNGIVDTSDDERLTAAGVVRLGDTLSFTVAFAAEPYNNTNDAQATSATWFTAALDVDVNNDATPEPVNGVLSDADSDGLYDSLDLSLDATYGQGNVEDGVVDTGNDERMTAAGNLQLGPTLTFDLAFGVTPAADSNDLSATTATWFTGALDVDVDDDGALEEVNFAFNDPNSDGVYGTLELSLDDLIYGEGILDDEVVNTNNDERLTDAADVHLGATLLFDLTFDDNPGGDNSDVRATGQTWFTGAWSIDVDANSTLESVNFSLGDANSDGLFDTLDVSLDSTYGQGNLSDGVVNTGNDERVTTSSTNVTLGSDQLFNLTFDGNPAADSSDARTASRSWYTGLVSVDVNANGVTEPVHFAFTDTESNGLYDTLDVSLDTTYGQGTLTDSLVNTGNDERLSSSPADLTLGATLLFSLAFVTNPGGVTDDVTLTTETWFQGTESLRLEGPRYDSLLADANSDGLYDEAYLDLSDDNDFDDPDDWGPLVSNDSFDDGGLELQYVILALQEDGSSFEVAPTDGTVGDTPDWWAGRVTVDAGSFAVAVSDVDADDVYDRADFDASGDKIVDDVGNAEGDQVTLGGQVYTVVDIADDGSSVTLEADMAFYPLYLPAVLYLYYPFENGGFEVGSLAYWTESGALNRRVVTVLDSDGRTGSQTLPAIEGSYTAELGDPGYVNVGGVPVGYADVRQTITLPDQGVTTLSFQYRVFTHDLIYSDFDDTYYDTFEVFLNSESYGSRRDSLCRLGGSWQAADGDGLILCAGNDTQFPTLGNPPYDTGLQTVSFDVSDYAGTNLTLIFRAYNRVDNNYNTWAYVDGVTFEP